MGPLVLLGIVVAVFGHALEDGGASPEEGIAIIVGVGVVLRTIEAVADFEGECHGYFFLLHHKASTSVPFLFVDSEDGLVIAEHRVLAFKHLDQNPGTQEVAVAVRVLRTIAKQVFLR